MAKIDDKQTVYLNSHDRLSGTDSDGYYAINLRRGNKFDRMTCLLAAIPKSFYTTSQAGINYFTLTESGTSVTVTIPVGNYSRSAFALILGQTMTTASPHAWNFVVSYPNSATEGDTGKYTITVSGNAGVQPSISFDTVTFINEPMGFLDAASTVTYTFSGDVLTSNAVCNLQIFQCIQIHSNLVGNPVMTGKNTDILQTVIANVGTPPYSNISWVCPDVEAFSVELASGESSVMRVYLTDEDNNPVDVNGVSIQLQVLFWKKNKGMRLLSGFIHVINGLLRRMYPQYFLREDVPQQAELTEDATPAEEE